MQNLLLCYCKIHKKPICSKILLTFDRDCGIIIDSYAPIFRKIPNCFELRADAYRYEITEEKIQHNEENIQAFPLGTR